MSKIPVVLMILDGYGLNERHDANAVYEANTPNIDGLMKNYPFVKGNASGLAVGLPDGQMGNSEVGHMNMGAGRIVYQELTRITKEINDGDFFKNPELLKAVENVKKNLKQNVYKTIIPRNIRLAEAPSHGLPINLYDSKSVGAENYRLLAQEVIYNDEGKEFDVNSFDSSIFDKKETKKSKLSKLIKKK